MADAKKCDKCNRFYDPYHKKHNKDIGLAKDGTTRKVLSINLSMNYDLCHKCCGKILTEYANYIGEMNGKNN